MPQMHLEAHWIGEEGGGLADGSIVGSMIVMELRPLEHSLEGR